MKKCVCCGVTFGPGPVRPADSWSPALPSEGVPQGSVLGPGSWVLGQTLSAPKSTIRDEDEDPLPTPETPTSPERSVSPVSSDSSGDFRNRQRKTNEQIYFLKVHLPVALFQLAMLQLAILALACDPCFSTQASPQEQEVDAEGQRNMNLDADDVTDSFLQSCPSQRAPRVAIRKTSARLGSKVNCMYLHPQLDAMRCLTSRLISRVSVPSTLIQTVRFYTNEPKEATTAKGGFRCF